MHFNAITLNQAQRIEESKSLLKVALIQGLPPLLSVVPAALVTVLFNLIVRIQNDESLSDLFTKLMLFSNPFIDGMTSLILIKPFKKAMKVWLTGIKEGKWNWGERTSTRVDRGS